MANTLQVLTDHELDAVAGGQSLFQGGLVNVGVNTGDIAVLNDVLDLDLNVEDVLNDSIKDIAIANNLRLGVVIAALGGAAGLIQRR